MAKATTIDTLEPALRSRAVGNSNILRVTGRFARRKPLGFVGGIFIVVMVVVAIFARYVTWHDPNAVPLNLQQLRILSPRASYIMGTDQFGRDVWARVAYGSRTSLEVGIIAVTIAATFGTTLGLVSGYFGGTLDLVMQRLVDTMMAIPGLVLGLVLVGMLGQALHWVMIAVGIISIPSYIRLVRGSVLSAKSQTYVEAAHALGAGHVRIMFRHILPNVAATIVILATAGLGQAILIEASLSFLGFGPGPPTASWGRMLSGESRAYMVKGAWWMSVFPGVAICLAVLGFNLLGDALRDIWDPRLRNS